jgi:hypothetical protein
VWRGSISRRAALPIRCSRHQPSHAGAVVLGLRQQLDAMALERGNDLCPDFAAHMPVARFLGNVQLATDLEAVHGAWRDAGGLGEFGDREFSQGACCRELTAVERPKNAP